MKTNIKNPKVMALTAAVVVLIGFLGTAYYFSNSKKDWMKSMDTEKLKSEQLLAEKGTLQKEILGIQNELAGLKTKNESLNKDLTNAKNDSDKYHKMANANNGSKKTIAQLKKELEAMKATKAGLLKELADAKSKLKGMEGENAELQKEIATLNANNKKLTEDLTKIKSLASDDYQVTAYKGKNDKLTICSKKTKKIVTKFTVPSYVASNAGFKIIMPDGQVIDKTAKGMSMTILDDVKDQYASVDGVTGTETMKKIQLVYSPDAKLKAGTYKVELYNGANYTASCFIQLK